MTDDRTFKPTHTIEVASDATLHYSGQPGTENIVPPFVIVAEFRPEQSQWFFLHPTTGAGCWIWSHHGKILLSWHEIVIHPSATLYDLRAGVVYHLPAVLGPVVAWTHLNPKNPIVSYYFEHKGNPTLVTAAAFLPGYGVEIYDPEKHAYLLPIVVGESTLGCPGCGADLLVDEEYMLKHEGRAYTSTDQRGWSFYCSDEDNCGKTYIGSELPALCQSNNG